MNLRNLMLVLPCAAVAAGCGDGGAGLTGPSELDSGVVGVPWKLTGLAGPGEPIAAPPEGTFRLELLPDGRIQVEADCNVCTGEYSLDGRAFEVRNQVLACTRAACRSAPVDTEYARLVSLARSWAGGAAELTLRGDEGTLTFERGGR